MNETHYLVEGYEYIPFKTYLNNDIQIIHRFRSPEGRLFYCDWSPHHYVPSASAKLWIELGMPTRIKYWELTEDDLVFLAEKKKNGAVLGDFDR